jgi:hypothetical protein
MQTTDRSCVVRVGAESPPRHSVSHRATVVAKLWWSPPLWIITAESPVAVERHQGAARRRCIHPLVGTCADEGCRGVAIQSPSHTHRPPVFFTQDLAWHRKEGSEGEDCGARVGAVAESRFCSLEIVDDRRIVMSDWHYSDWRARPSWMRDFDRPKPTKQHRHLTVGWFPLSQVA